MSEERTVTCTRGTDVVRIQLGFEPQDMLDFRVFRKNLKAVFPITRRLPVKVVGPGIVGFRPEKGFYTADGQSFVWKQAGAIYLQSEGEYDREAFISLLGSIIEASKGTIAGDYGAHSAWITVIKRFAFDNYDEHEFKLDRYFSIVPKTPVYLNDHPLWLMRGETKLHYADYDGTSLDVGLSFPANRSVREYGFAELAFTHAEPYVGFQSVNCAYRALALVERLVFDIMTPELRLLLEESGGRQRGQRFDLYEEDEGGSLSECG